MAKANVPIVAKLKLADFPDRIANSQMHLVVDIPTPLANILEPNALA